MPASSAVIKGSAKARAARGGLASSRYSNDFLLSCSFQYWWARKPPTACSQNDAVLLVIGVRLKFLISSSSAFFSGESSASGGPGRNSLTEARTHGFQVPAIGRIGFVPFHLPGSLGTVPVHFASAPSALPCSMTRAATFFPSAMPASTSLG